MAAAPAHRSAAPAEPILQGVPLATWSVSGNRRLLTAADGPAVFAGQALADAQAICPTLVLRPADPPADAELLERLALWGLRWTPLAAVDGTDGLLLDLTGSADLFGGEAAVLRQVYSGLQRSGFTVQAALAGAAEAAAALARAADGTIVPPGEVVSGLSRLGLQTVGDLLRQPRGPLARRFGRVLLDVLDGLSGARTRPVRPVREPAAFLVLLDCLEPIITRTAIEHGVEGLLVELCRQLLEAGRGARQLTLRCWRVDGAVQEAVIGTGAAVRDVAHLRRLFADPLGTLEPDLGFERLLLEANRTDPLAGVQAVLRGELGEGDLHEGSAGLTALIDRLGQRLVIYRLRLLDSHWPEYAAVPADPFEMVALPLPADEPPRPVQLFAKPIPLSVIAAKPHGPPAQLGYAGRQHRIDSWIGPERLEPEWWGADAARPVRDYYRVQCLDGARLWICRLVEPDTAGPPRWFLHRVFA